jgi:hypothetical protein
VIESVESSGARAIDQTHLEGQEYGLQPQVFAHVRPIYDLNVFIPQATRYPRWFAATVRSSRSGPPNAATDLMVLTKSTGMSPWRIAFITGSLDATNTLVVPPPYPSPSGYDVISYIGNPAPSTWLGDLASYYATWKDTGHAPRPNRFDPGSMTDQKGLELTQNRQDSTDGYARQTFAFVPPSSSQQWMVGFGEIALMCGNITEISTDTALGVGLNQNASRYNWGPEIAPGRYRSISENWVYPVCVYSDSAHRGKFHVFGNLDSQTSETAVH